MGKKQIVVPKDSVAQQALDVDAAADADLIEVTLNPEEYRLLWERGVFAMMNEVSNGLIDDFEDERIADQDCLKAISSRLKVLRAGADREFAGAVRILQFLADEALLRDTEVHFFF